MQLERTARSADYLLLLLLPTALWGSNVVVARALVQGMPSMTLVVCRWTLALFVLLPIAGPALWRQRHLVRKNGPFLVLLSLLGIVGFNTAVFVALQYTTAINGTLIQGGIPVTVICLSWLINREHISLRTWLAMLASFLGLVIIVTRGKILDVFSIELNPGDVMIAVGTWLWGLYIVLVNRRPIGLSAAPFLLVLILIGDVVIALFCATGLAGDLSFELTAGRGVGMLYIAIFPSALAYYLWNRGIGIFGPNAGAQFQYLLPVFGSLFAVIFLDESFESFHVVGTFLIFAGVYLATKTLSRKTT